MSWSRMGRCTVLHSVLWILSEELTLTINCSCLRMMYRNGNRTSLCWLQLGFAYCLPFPPIRGNVIYPDTNSCISSLCDIRVGTGCSGHGAEWVPLSEETSWTNSMTRTLLWIISWVCTRRRRAMTGARPTSPNIPISSTRWRLTTDRYTYTVISQHLA